MNNVTSAQDYERTAALRRATFELLDEHLRRATQYRDSKIITCLQEVANRLGALEQSLLGKAADEQRVGSPPVSSVPAMQSNGEVEAAGLPLSGEAAAVLALGEALIPLAGTSADEAERWLRIMRQHGNVGQALASLGMDSGQLATPATLPPQRNHTGRDLAGAITAEASRFASGRRASTIETVDVLCGVIRQYGPLFDRALYSATSKSQAELFEALDQSRQLVS